MVGGGGGGRGGVGPGVDSVRDCVILLPLGGQRHVLAALGQNNSDCATDSVLRRRGGASDSVHRPL